MKIKPLASHMVDKCFTIELYPQPSVFVNIQRCMDITEKLQNHIKAQGRKFLKSYTTNFGILVYFLLVFFFLCQI